jgi:hypothetical protein
VIRWRARRLRLGLGTSGRKFGAGARYQHVHGDLGVFWQRDADHVVNRAWQSSATSCKAAA